MIFSSRSREKGRGRQGLRVILYIPKLEKRKKDGFPLEYERKKEFIGIACRSPASGLYPEERAVYIFKSYGIDCFSIIHYPLGGKMKRTLLKPDECYLHIIDPQQSLMAQIHQAERVTAVIKLMLACARILNIPVIANTQYKKGLGDYVPDLEPMMEGISRPDKTEFSALANEQTRQLVEHLPGTITTPILVGVETHICIYQTAKTSLERGLSPWIVADGVSSRTRENHQLGLDVLRSQGATIGPAEMIVYELLGKAGTPQFKEMLPFILDFSKNIK